MVNAVCPGAVHSEMWLEQGGLLDQHVERTGAEDRERALEKLHAAKPAGRLATTAEIAGAIVFLCSERASYVSGAAWSVDAGTVQVII
jgi:3-oxoacyl-[acyl-carrier protein] reductase